MSDPIEFDASESYTPEWHGNRKKAEPFTVRIFRMSVLELEEYQTQISAAKGHRDFCAAVSKVITGPHPPFKFKTPKSYKLIDTPEKLCLETPRTMVEELMRAINEVQGFKGVREKNSEQPSGGEPTTQTTQKTQASPEREATELTQSSGAGDPSTPTLN